MMDLKKELESTSFTNKAKPTADILICFPSRNVAVRSARHTLAAMRQNIMTKEY